MGKTTYAMGMVVGKFAALHPPRPLVEGRETEKTWSTVAVSPEREAPCSPLLSTATRVPRLSPPPPILSPPYIFSFLLFCPFFFLEGKVMLLQWGECASMGRRKKRKHSSWFSFPVSMGEDSTDPSRSSLSRTVPVETGDETIHWGLEGKMVGGEDRPPPRVVVVVSPEEKWHTTMTMYSHLSTPRRRAVMHRWMAQMISARPARPPHAPRTAKWETATPPAAKATRVVAVGWRVAVAEGATGEGNDRVGRDGDTLPGREASEDDDYSGCARGLVERKTGWTGRPSDTRVVEGGR